MKTIFKNLSVALILGIVVMSAGGCESANSNVDTSVDAGASSGEISGVWEKGTTHNITGDVIIPEGKSLTIEEGVTVIMDPLAKTEFIVKGNLYSLGTVDNPVKFTIQEIDRTEENKFGKKWGGILAAKTCAELILDHTILEYGGSTTSDASSSVKLGLYKAVAGENLPALWFSNVNGKLVVTNSIIRNFQEDCTYIEGGNIIFSNNMFYTTGVSGGEAMNFKSGCLVDAAYNLVYSANTNAFKLSNAGVRTPQADIVAYNNTFVNTGWRRPTAKGGSVWVENAVIAHIHNNLFANTRFGIKRDTKLLEDARSSYSHNYYYGYDQTTVNQFQPSTDVIGGTSEIRGTTAGQNDPSFVNYPLNNPVSSSDFNTSWDFHLKSNSTALGKGTTTFTRHFNDPITFSNGLAYSSPAPSTFIGAYDVIK
ncbi:right-handed parallel beta-helix repeat-containing protein [Flavobacterium algicola]|uniref:right-handed parallel beta-helix repeat-containing protein n=1 Tax=Flavobacterium algicola TaxID=556529 RepID=UPI001EFD58DA|nr:right-handed parallel beta-helix repeat-containing protein [Flavobacterium algicola]MCG9793541.1 right-handed parallel beta-helix repeat-containing protein [Flavobacterium algicola]